MYGNGADKSTCMTRQAIVGYGLASIALIITILPLKPVIAQDNNLIAKVSKELPIVRSAALGTNIDVPWSQPAFDCRSI